MLVELTSGRRVGFDLILRDDAPMDLQVLDLMDGLIKLDRQVGS